MDIARFYPVKTGISTEMEVEIRSPEIKGPVVILGQHLLQDGVNVTLTAVTDDSIPVKDSSRSPGQDKGRGR
jgi:hypothetical protein